MNHFHTWSHLGSLGLFERCGKVRYGDVNLNIAYSTPHTLNHVWKIGRVDSSSLVSQVGDTMRQ